MFKVFKGLLLIIIVMNCFCLNKAHAGEAYFVWEKTQIDIPLNDSLEKYKNKYEISFYVNGKKSTDFTVEKEVNCSTFSTVLTNKLGKYTVYYKAKSEKYYVSSTQAIIFNVIDVTKPQITKISDVVIESGREFEIDKYFYISDDTTSRDELTILIDDSYVLYSMVGTYDASITAIDKYNNQSKIDFQIKIVDNTKPQISVIKPLILSYGSFLDVSEYFLATDNCNGDLTKLIVIDGLDNKKLGLQEIIVSVTDYSNNSNQIKVSATVIDDQKPVFLLKQNEVTLDVGNFKSYDYDFFKSFIVDVSDNHTKFENLIIRIDYSKMLNSISDYEIIYTIEDESGNYSTDFMIVKLREMNGPNIIGEDVVTIKLGEDIDLLSLVEVEDYYDENAKEKLEILSTNFDKNVAGKYEITYICYNSSGNYSTKIVVINVIDDNPKMDLEEEDNKTDLIEDDLNKDDEIIEENFWDKLKIDKEFVLKAIFGILVVILIIIVFKKRK